MKSFIEYVDEEFLTEARFKRVVRKGKVVRKMQARKGFRIIRAKGGKLKMRRVTPMERRKMHIAMQRAWRKGKAARLQKSKRMRIRSLIKRKTVFGNRKSR